MKELSHSARENYSICVAMGLLATVMATIRFLLRRDLKRHLIPAEWLCLLSLVLFYGYIGEMLYYIFHGSGTADFNVYALQSLTEARKFMKMGFVHQLLFGAVITAVKLSILFFYHSIFFINRNFTRVLIVSGLTCIAWFVVITFVVIFQCKPVDAFWNMVGMPPYCNSFGKTLLGYEVTNLALDILILCLPIAMIGTLKLPMARKVSVAAIFLLGGFVCVASLLRLRYVWILSSLDSPVNIPMLMFLSTVQLGLGITCCCLPTFGPIFLLVAPLVQRVVGVCGLPRNRLTASAQRSRIKRHCEEDIEALALQQTGGNPFDVHFGSSDTLASRSGEYPVVPGASRLATPN